MLYAITADVAHWLRLTASAPRKFFGVTGEDFLLRAVLHEGNRSRNSISRLIPPRYPSLSKPCFVRVRRRARPERALLLMAALL